MTIAVQSLLEAFDGLSDPERQEAAVEIFRRVTPHEGELSEDALVQAAEELFRSLDSEEGTDAST